MRKTFGFIFLLLTLACRGQAADLKVGDMAPDFKTVDDQGKPVALKDFKGKTVILYFYPKDDTPGCTIEAQSYRDHHSEFQTMGTVILGVSFDGQESHRLFKEKYKLNFPLLVDSDHKIAQAYGAAGTLFASRDVIMIDARGRIIKIMRKVDPDTVVNELLKDLVKTRIQST